MAVTSTLTITTSSAVEVTIDGANVYDVAGGIGHQPLTFPRTIMTDTTYHVTNVPHDVVVSIRRNGLELATATGERARFNFPRDAGKSCNVATVGDPTGAAGATPDGWAYGTTRIGVYYSTDDPRDSQGGIAGVDQYVIVDTYPPTTGHVYEAISTIPLYHNDDPNDPDTEAIRVLAIAAIQPHLTFTTDDAPATPPASGAEGDIWIDSVIGSVEGVDDGQFIYRRTSGAWVLDEDQSIVTVALDDGVTINADGTIYDAFVGIPNGYGPGSLLCHINPIINGPGQRGGRWYTNLGTAGAPTWRALPVTGNANSGFDFGHWDD